MLPDRKYSGVSDHWILFVFCSNRYNTDFALFDSRSKTSKSLKTGAEERNKRIIV